MTYHRDNKIFSKRAYLLFGIIASLLLLFIWGASIPKVATDVLASIASPIWNARVGASENTDTLQSIFTSKQKLVKENESLRFQLREARLSLLGTNALRKEYEELLGITNGDEDSSIFARVLARPPTTVYDTFIIDQGRPDGVIEGALVFAGGNVVLGEIHEVHEDTSQAQLYSTYGIETNVVIGTDGITASAQGRGGGNFISFVPIDVEVEEGSTVLLASGGSSTVIGVVGSIQEESGNTIKKILFNSPVNPSTIVFVSIEDK